MPPTTRFTSGLFHLYESNRPGSEPGVITHVAGSDIEIYGPDPLPQALTEQMMDAWLAFAKTGNPNHSKMPNWPAYDASTRATMIFDTNEETLMSEVVDDPDASERAFWDGVPFDGVTPTWKPEDL